MATNQTTGVLGQLRRVVLQGPGPGPTDGQLLDSFTLRRDEAAFEALLRRHGPMVLGVCRRVLRDFHLAEDAFQATFLVLARKAGSIKTRETIAAWLYRVAFHAALRAKSMADQRKERPMAEMPEPATPGPGDWHDEEPILDKELSLLPERYRVLFVLCELEGKTRKEAAQQLGLPEGTVSSRLARAKALLAKRIGRNGGALAAGSLSACMPSSLVTATVKAATGTGDLVSARVTVLTKGVLNAMLLAKFRGIAVTVFLLASFVFMGGGMVWHSQATAKGPQERPAVAGKPAKDKDDDNLKNTIWALEERREEAVAKGDVETQQKFLADDHLSVSADGRYDKAALGDGAKNRRIADLKTREVEVRRVNDDVAVLTYVYDCKVTTNDGDVIANRRDRRYSCVWALRKGGWVVVFTQDTIMPGGE